MAVVTISGDPGCHVETFARLVAARTGFTPLSESELRRLLAEEYSDETAVGGRLFATALTPILARLASKAHLVVHCPGAEHLAAPFPGTLRLGLTASEPFRIGTLMLDHGLEREPARQLLHQIQRQERLLRRRRFGRATPPLESFDIIWNVESRGVESAADLVCVLIEHLDLAVDGLLPVSAEIELQFAARLRLARHRIAPAGLATLAARRPFANDSEQMFASLLDFYRIAWEYEPRSFPIQWDRDGKATESFTPDFYLPELDLYVELTTMKQAHVTRKNRKVKLLRTIYPHVNIQVFYQKDFHNLIFKYGITGRSAPA